MQLDEVIADLMRTSGDRLLRLAYQLCHDRAGAEDLVQEALTRVYGSWLRRAPSIDNREAYVRRAILNEFLRRRRLRSSSELVTDDLPDVGADARRRRRAGRPVARTRDVAGAAAGRAGAALLRGPA